jgi:hypothetical protein
LSTVSTDPPAPAGHKPVPPRQTPEPGKHAEVRPVTIDAPRKLIISGHSLSATGPLALVTNLKQQNLFTRVVLEKSLRNAQEQEARFEFEVVVEW